MYSGLIDKYRDRLPVAADTRAISLDVRVVAATARDLAREVRERRFREDLYYRLNVVPIWIPPLRERREDIPRLVEHLIARLNQGLGTRVKGATALAVSRLVDAEWPGNVRELENALERAMVLARGGVIRRSDLPHAVAVSAARKGLSQTSSPTSFLNIEPE